MILVFTALINVVLVLLPSSVKCFTGEHLVSKQSDVQIGGRPPAELMNRLIRHGRGRVPDLFIQLPSPKKHARRGWELPMKMG